VLVGNFNLRIGALTVLESTLFLILNGARIDLCEAFDARGTDPLDWPLIF
jgi:hypothetical protein